MIHTEPVNMYTGYKPKPTKMINKEVEGDTKDVVLNGNCPICYNKIWTLSNVNVTNCGHQFCTECSSEWFDNRERCKRPLCMSDVTTLYSYPTS
jgi:hypothetical protein